MSLLQMFLPFSPLRLPSMVMESPNTSSSSRTLKLPAVLLGSFSLVHFASMMQSYFDCVGLKLEGNLLSCEPETSSSCKASLLQHSPHMGLECPFVCHTFIQKVALVSWFT
ncbi:hypothetical protein SLA2020_065980 [Shorea laevis]